MLNIFTQFPLWLRISLIFPLAFLNGWLLVIVIHHFEPLVSIFITASLLSFLLDAPIRLLQRKEISRSGAMAIVFALAFLILGLITLFLVPLIVQQLSEFVESLPQWIESGNEHLNSLEQWGKNHKYSTYFQNSISQIVDKLSSLLQSLSSQLLDFVVSTVGSVLNILLVLILTIFLVIYGEQVWDGIFSWVPSPWNIRLRESVRHTFANYFEGQAILAGIVSVAQTVILTVLNIPYALLFGVTIGLATFIPYASSLAILLISSLLMLQSFWLGIKVLVFTILFGIFNDNVIAPRLMGGIIGLNPVWIILSLLIGGKLAGILGLLIAIPLASVIKNTVDILRSAEHLDDSQILIIHSNIDQPQKEPLQ